MMAFEGFQKQSHPLPLVSKEPRVTQRAPCKHSPRAGPVWGEETNGPALWSQPSRRSSQSRAETDEQTPPPGGSTLIEVSRLVPCWPGTGSN